MTKTFKEINDGNDIEKVVKKAGLSLAIIFSKEEQLRFGIKYGSVIKLNNAEIVEIPKNL
jgi:hypothetical protein